MTRCRLRYSMTSKTTVVALAVIVGLFAAGGANAQPDLLDAGQFNEDLNHLTAAPHRLAGSPEAKRAVNYIETRLRGMGIEELYTVHMPVWQLTNDMCELHIGEKTIPLSPMRPNLSVPPATPEAGLSGPLLYVGKGGIEDYGDVSPEDAIVMLDYDCFANWETAFSLGAKAVIFVGDGTETPREPHHTELPVNLVRLYADRGDIGSLDPGVVHEKATVYSDIEWRQEHDRNLIVRIPGTNPVLAETAKGPEALVLAASYDTYGMVPHRSPGARRAANVAALLGAASYFQENPLPRHLILMFLGNRAHNHQGAREIYDKLLMPQEKHNQLIDAHQTEHDTFIDVHELLTVDGLAYDKEKEAAEPLREMVRYQTQ